MVFMWTKLKKGGKMNTRKRQYKLLKKLLELNPKMTVGEAAHRLQILADFIKQRDELSNASIMCGVLR